MSKHYLLSPSGSSRWLTCTGSLRLSKGLPDTGTVYANEGTHAHLVASEALEQGVEASEVERDSTPELCEAVQEYLNHIRGIRESGICVLFAVEELIESKKIEDFGGTIDCLIIHKPSKTDESRTMHIVDYKHGSGIPVLAEENTQALCYLLLAREKHGQCQNYFVSIVQPRTAGPAVETVEVSNEELDAFEKHLLERINAEEEFHAGDHCQFCKAIGKCETLHQLTMDVCKLELDKAATDDDDIVRWIEIMESTPAIRALLTKIPVLVMESMKRGVKFSGYKAVMSVGNREWTLPEVEMMAKLKGRKLKLDDYAPRKLATPTQVDKLGFGPQIEEFVVRKERGLVAVGDKDRRKAVDFEVEDFDDLSFLL